MTRMTDELDESRLRQTIAALLDHVAPLVPHVEYRLIGTAAAAIRGVRLPVGDIDLLFRSHQDLDRVAVVLAMLPAAQCLISPGTAQGGRLYFARYLVEGVTVELSMVEDQPPTDTDEYFGSGAWEHYGWVGCGRYSVPVVALELRLLTELARDRPNRYLPIAAHLRERSCNMDLIRRGLAHAGPSVPQDLKTEMPPPAKDEPAPAVR